MKNILLLIILSILNGKLNAQTQNIDLPEVDSEIGVIGYPYLDIYVTKEGRIIHDSDTINIYQLKERIYTPIKKSPFVAEYSKKQIHIFADKDVNYEVIDAIKTEVSATNSSKYIVYRSNFNKKKKSDKKYVSPFNRIEKKGIKHKSPMSYYSFMPPKYLKTKKEIRERDSINEAELKLFPDLASMPSSKLNNSKWITYSTEEAIYSVQEEVINEALVDKKYKCYSISNEGFLDIELRRIELNKTFLEKTLSNLDIVFLKYEKDLKYNNYIKFIEVLQELKPNFKNDNYAEVIELSSQILALHKNYNIKICD